MNTEIIANDKSNLFWRAGLLAFALFALVCAGAIGAANAQQPKRKIVAKTKPAAPRTVYDYYLRLPAKFFPFLERVKDRRDFVDSDDRKNDYLSFGANVPLAPEHAEMILLKRMNGDVYIVVSFLDHRESDGKAVLHFLEYNNGRFTAADAAPPLDLERARRIYRRKTGESAPDDATMIYKISPSDKSITVRINDTDTYRLEWTAMFTISHWKTASKNK